MCEREHANRHSVMAIVVKRGRQVIGHVPETLDEILTPMLEDGRHPRVSSRHIPEKEIF